MTSLRDGDRGRFLEDIGVAASTLWRAPALLLAAVLVEVGIPDVLNLIWRPGKGLGGFFSAVVSLIVLAGFVGTERLWFKRLWAGDSLSLRQAAQVTRVYVGRYVRLGLMATIATLMPFSLAAGLVLRMVDPRPSRAAFGMFILAFAYVWVVIGDVLATFMTPALAFSTASARRAWAIGWQLVRREWPASAPYVVFPPLAFVIGTRLIVSSGQHWVGYALGPVATVVALVVKGATARFYLRLDIPAEAGAEPLCQAG
ncbi:MAG TPA: hypothetical protein VG015_05600 [Candidatus Dormibacteraeota bacterium]|jgi:hypothetical protein|nr:hypothetical protein [Candidatus Dormibacteraeota bacterium]